MIHTVKKISAQFAALGTRLWRSYHDSPYRTVRIKLIVLFFVFGTVVIYLIGIIVNRAVRDDIYRIVDNPHSVRLELMLQEVTNELWIGRILSLIFFGISALIVAELSIQPIKQTAKRQKDFIANVSHELRTPLAVMRMGIDVALRHKNTESSDGMRVLLHENLKELDRMNEIVQFLLEFSQYERNKKQLVMEEVSLLPLVKQVIDRCQDSRTTTGVDITCSGDTAWVMGNRIALETAFMNLLKNAIKYTPSDGSVSVVVKRSHYPVVSIRDSGVGIAPADLPHIFNPFFRGTDADNIAKGGLGLGLSIVREIMTLHGAKIQVQSTLGNGSVFTVHFPALRHVMKNMRRNI